VRCSLRRRNIRRLNNLAFQATWYGTWQLLEATIGCLLVTFRPEWEDTPAVCLVCGG